MDIRRIEDHRDNRGFVVNPFEQVGNTGDISNCHAFSIEKGCSRGNHLHPGRNEQVLVLAGEITVESNGKASVMSWKTPSILTIPSGEPHAFFNKGDETAVVLCWSSSRNGSYRGEDTVR